MKPCSSSLVVKTIAFNRASTIRYRTDLAKSVLFLPFSHNHFFFLRTTFFFSERPVDIAINIGVLSISNIEEENMVSNSEE